MAQQAAVSPQLKQLDPTWSRIRNEAEDIIKADPSLGGFIFSSVLNHDRLECALTHRLAQRLGNADIGAELIVQAFDDALEEDPGIGDAIRAELLGPQERKLFMTTRLFTVELAGEASPVDAGTILLTRVPR